MRSRPCAPPSRLSSANERSDTQPTFFEVTTAVAFELFRRASVELAVVEVGLGGRLDATNVITPEVTAITSIAYDHQLYLGTSLASIASEKAGIIKHGIPVVVGDVGPGSPGGHRGGRPRERGAASSERSHPTSGDHRGRFAGRSPARNAAVAMKLLETLEDRGTPIGRDAIVDGACVTHHGRDGSTSGVCPTGAKSSWTPRTTPPARRRSRRISQSLPDRRCRWCSAAMRDKDAAAMFRALLPGGRLADSHARGEPAIGRPR